MTSMGHKQNKKLCNQWQFSSCSIWGEELDYTDGREIQNRSFWCMVLENTAKNSMERKSKEQCKGFRRINTRILMLNILK